MMKLGYKHRTSVFGDDSEEYVSSLLLMANNPNGSLRPDLISVNGRVKPKLSIELKSGSADKGVMVDRQLVYGLTTEHDYRELFSEDVGKTLHDGLLAGEGWSLLDLLALKTPVAYYYGLINRVDGLRTQDVELPFSSLKIRWGDISLVPHKFAFVSYATQRSLATGESFGEVIDKLRQVMRYQLTKKGSIPPGYALTGELDSQGKRNKHSWMNLHGSDVKALFYGTEKEVSSHARIRIDQVRSNYPQLDDLVRVEIPGPLGTTLRILAEKDHKDLFDVQVRRIVLERTPIIESVADERKEAVRRLEEIVYNNAHRKGLLFPMSLPRGTTAALFSGLEPEPKPYTLVDVSLNEVERFSRLEKWLATGELSPSEKLWGIGKKPSPSYAC